jgi:hypothetical protein
VSGSIHTLDLNFKARRETTFENGLITGVALPPLDAASKDPGYFEVTIRPESTRVLKGDGSTVKPPPVKAKLWLTSHFRLNIDGLETKKVSRIEAFSIALVPTQTAEVPLPGKPDPSDLVVTLPETDSESWSDWFEDFVVKGESGPDREKTGVIEILNPTLKDSLCAIELRGLGIYSLSPAPEIDNGKVVKTLAKMYCQEAAIVFAAK